jgi:hypothetical protein
MDKGLSPRNIRKGAVFFDLGKYSPFTTVFMSEDTRPDLTISVNQEEYFLFELLADIIGYPLKEHLDSQKVARSYERAVERALEETQP